MLIAESAYSPFADGESGVSDLAAHYEYVWQLIYSPFNGGLNSALTAMGLESLQLNWIGDPNTALFAIAFAHI